MDETIKNVANENKQPVPETNDQLKEAIEAQLSKIRRQSMLLGSQVMLHTILDKIVSAMKQPGKRTMNDYKRLIKDLEKFCVTGLSRKVNEDGETESIDNNNTKLMEASDESNTNESN